ncbi:hypothetical protein MRB53_038617 [Persea americana]|nr:hypothetical protein MRB53_038617 [Persea americana]
MTEVILLASCASNGRAQTQISRQISRSYVRNHPKTSSFAVNGPHYFFWVISRRLKCNFESQLRINGRTGSVHHSASLRSTMSALHCRRRDHDSVVRGYTARQTRRRDMPRVPFAKGRDKARHEDVKSNPQGEKASRSSTPAEVSACGESRCTVHSCRREDEAVQGAPCARLCQTFRRCCLREEARDKCSLQRLSWLIWTRQALDLYLIGSEERHERAFGCYRLNIVLCGRELRKICSAVSWPSIGAVAVWKRRRTDTCGIDNQWKLRRRRYWSRYGHRAYSKRLRLKADVQHRRTQLRAKM